MFGAVAAGAVFDDTATMHTCCRDAHGYPNIRINPDNKLSGNIRIINYAFNYPSTWRLILIMYFLCSFSKILSYFTKNLYINTSISKIIAADLNVLPLGYTSATLRYPPLPAPL